MVIPVSAKTQEGLEDLLEAILLVAEETDIRANPLGKVFGTVIEGELDRSKGVVATLLVQNGTLKVGQTVVTGNACGRIRAMFDYRGEPIKQAGPSVPVQIMGLDVVPTAGDPFETVVSEKIARSIVEERQLEIERATEPRRGYSLDDIFARFQAGETKTLNLIVKADVQGSLEPIVNSLNGLHYDELEGQHPACGHRQHHRIGHDVGDGFRCDSHRLLCRARFGRAHVGRSARHQHSHVQDHLQADRGYRQGAKGHVGTRIRRGRHWTRPRSARSFISGGSGASLAVMCSKVRRDVMPRARLWRDSKILADGERQFTQTV